MEIEIEKTYLAKYIPQDLTNYPFSQITDSYFKIRDNFNRIRIRETDDIIELTKKSPTNELNHGINKEETILLSKVELENFKTIPSDIISKKRYFYLKNNINYEIDVFEGELSGLIMIDVEFKNKELYNNFVSPDFCLCDVTHEKEIAGNKLLGKTYNDLENFLNNKGYQKLSL